MGRNRNHTGSSRDGGPDRSSDQGLPIGAQLIGPMFEDRTPIRFAELLETEFRGFDPPPLGLTGRNWSQGLAPPEKR